MNIEKDDYIFMHVEWIGGFKHTVPCRGYNLKSQINFTKSLSYIKDFFYVVVTKEEYDNKVFGPDEKENADEPRTRKTKALKENSPKRKPRAKASEDSKGVRDRRKGTTSIGKTKRTELREPKMSDVRKPKKNVARTNNSGKETLSRTRSSKSKT